MQLKTILQLLSLFAGIPVSAQAVEPHWCSFHGFSNPHPLSYPPIARLARVQGQSILRLTYTADGKIEGIEALFGPQLLNSLLIQQLNDQTVLTKDQGLDKCMSLLIISSHLEGSQEPLENKSEQAPPTSIWRVTLRAEPVAIIFSNLDPMSRRYRISYSVRSHYRHLKRMLHF